MADPIFLETGIIGVQFGERVKVVRPANMYGCTIGDECFVGPFVEIQRNVTIGRRCRIQSHAFICELVTIGDDCFIGHGVMFINDPFSTGGPARGDTSVWRSTRIGSGVSIGSNATIRRSTSVTVRSSGPEPSLSSPSRFLGSTPGTLRA